MTDAIAGYTCDPERDECTGGLRKVDRLYVERHQPNYPPPFPNPLTPEEHEANAAHVASIAARRESLANTVYPCPVHDPELFLKWRAGEWPYPKGKARPRELPQIGRPAATTQGTLDDEFADLPPMPPRKDVD